MRSDPINSGIALAARGRLAARGFLRGGLSLMCSLARHGAQIHLSSEGRRAASAVRLPVSDVGEPYARERTPEAATPPLGLRLKSVTLTSAITWERIKRDAIIAAKELLFLFYRFDSQFPGRRGTECLSGKNCPAKTLKTRTYE